MVPPLAASDREHLFGPCTTTDAIAAMTALPQPPPQTEHDCTSDAGGDWQLQNVHVSESERERALELAALVLYLLHLVHIRFTALSHVCRLMS
jgi:hypothetical protein